MRALGMTIFINKCLKHQSKRNHFKTHFFLNKSNYCYSSFIKKLINQHLKEAFQSAGAADHSLFSHQLTLSSDYHIFQSNLL